MERLTKWNGSKWILPQGRTSTGRSYWREIADVLAKYEDMGSPEEIAERLKGSKGKIKVIVKHPYLAPMVCYIDNTLEEMQMIVGGYIETVTQKTTPAVVICNEEGRLNELPFNMMIGNVDFVGTIIIAGDDGEEFTDVPEEIIRKYGL